MLVALDVVLVEFVGGYPYSRQLARLEMTKLKSCIHRLPTNLTRASHTIRAGQTNVGRVGTALGSEFHERICRIACNRDSFGDELVAGCCRAGICWEEHSNLHGFGNIFVKQTFQEQRN